MISVFLCRQIFSGVFMQMRCRAVARTCFVAAVRAILDERSSASSHDAIAHS